MDWEFSMAAMRWLADHRPGWLTPPMQLASFMGEIEGYILIGTLIYVAFDKRLAIRLMLIVTLTMCFNHGLKMLIQNPRPFIAEGDSLQKWAVPHDYARELAVEYSTPSGHAMAAAAFYSSLLAWVRNRWVRVAAMLAIVLTGVSRPYLGVHYVEDILLGWGIGLGVAVVAVAYSERIGAWWNSLAYLLRIAIAVAASLVFWATTLALDGGQIGTQPRAFLGYAGTVTGIVIARPLELALVDFDPRSSSPLAKVLRYLFSVALAIAMLGGLEELFRLLASDYSLAGYGLQYLRYVILGVAGILVAPWLFTRMGLAKSTKAAPDLAEQRSRGTR